MPWKQGSKVPLNIYDSNGEPVCQCHDAEHAELIVLAVNTMMTLTLTYLVREEAAQKHLEERHDY